MLSALLLSFLYPFDAIFEFVCKVYLAELPSAHHETSVVYEPVPVVLVDNYMIKLVSTDLVV